MRLMAYLVFLTFISSAQTLVLKQTGTPRPGETFSMTLTGSGLSGTSSLQYALSIPTGLTVSKWTAIVAGKTLACSTDGTICVLYSLGTTPIPDGDLATVQLTVTPAANSKSIPLPMVQLLGASQDGSQVSITSTTATVSVLPPRCDVTEDFKVDAADISASLTQLFAALSAAMQNQSVSCSPELSGCSVVGLQRIINAVSTGGCK